MGLEKDEKLLMFGGGGSLDFDVLECNKMCFGSLDWDVFSYFNTYFGTCFHPYGKHAVFFSRIQIT
jgi:hypothetical protein